jgi:hypothetical protein
MMMDILVLELLADLIRIPSIYKSIRNYFKFVFLDYPFYHVPAALRKFFSLANLK